MRRNFSWMRWEEYDSARSALSSQGGGKTRHAVNRVLGLLPVHALSGLPPSTDVAAFDRARQQDAAFCRWRIG
jgi:hypothetical protein